MFIFDKLHQMHPLAIIVLVGCTMTYITILYEISTEPFKDSPKYPICAILSTISIFSVLYALVNVNDKNKLQGIVILTYIVLSTIMNILK